MRRFFAKNLFFVISINLLIKPVWVFLIDRTVQNKVGHSSYGIYYALFNLGLVFQILLDFGINNYNSKTIAQYPGKIKTLFPAMLSARLVLNVFYLIIVLGIGLALGYRGWQMVMLMGVLLIQSLNSLMLFLRSNVSGLHKFKIDGVLSITDRLLMIIICGVLLLTPFTAKHFKIEWFIEAQIASYAIATIIGFFVVKRLARSQLRFSFEPIRVISIIKKSLPYALLIFLMSIYTRADSMLIERLSGVNGSEQAGIYATAYRLLDVGNMFGLMFASMLLPLFGRMLVKKNDVQPIVQLCVNLLLPASLLITVSGIRFSSEIMHLLYNDTTETNITVFMWLMVAFPAFSLSNVYSTLLTANGNLKLLNKIAFIGVVLNLSLNFYLIPKYFSLGAAFTACITQSVLAICFMLFAQKQVNLPRNVKWNFSFLLFLASIITTAYTVKMLPIHWILQAAMLFMGGVIMMLLFKFVSLKAVRQLMSRE